MSAPLFFPNASQSPFADQLRAAKDPNGYPANHQAYPSITTLGPRIITYMTKVNQYYLHNPDNRQEFESLKNDLFIYSFARAGLMFVDKPNWYTIQPYLAQHGPIPYLTSGADQTAELDQLKKTIHAILVNAKLPDFLLDHTLSKIITLAGKIIVSALQTPNYDQITKQNAESASLGAALIENFAEHLVIRDLIHSAFPRIEAAKPPKDDSKTNK